MSQSTLTCLLARCWLLPPFETNSWLPFFGPFTATWLIFAGDCKQSEWKKNTHFRVVTPQRVTIADLTALDSPNRVIRNLQRRSAPCHGARCDAKQKGKPLTQGSSSGRGAATVCDPVTHAELLTVPSRAHVRTKPASSGGASGAVLWHSVACWWVCRSLAVNGPPTAPLLVPWPLVFPSHYTRTKKGHWHGATFLMFFPERELGVLLQTCLSCVT